LGAALLGTARSWRGIVSFTHLAREGRMTVTIGRRELLVALGGAAVAWPLSARMGSLVRCTCPVHILEAGSACLNVRCARLEFQRDKRPFLGRPLGKTGFGLR